MSTIEIYLDRLKAETGSLKVQWPVTESVIGSISVLDRKDNQRPAGVAWVNYFAGR